MATAIGIVISGALLRRLCWLVYLLSSKLLVGNPPPDPTSEMRRCLGAELEVGV